MKKIINLIGLFFIIVGIFVFVMFNLFIFNFNIGIKNPKETSATITKINNDEVYILYKVDDKEYERKIDFYSSSMYVGEEIKIVYEGNNPNKFNVKIQEYLSTKGFIKYIFYIIPIIFILTGLIILTINIVKSSKKKKLLYTGLMVMGDIRDIRYNNMVNILGRHQYVICASFIYNNLVYESKSEELWFDVEYILKTYDIKQVPIYIDINNPKNNIMDVSEIKSKLGN